MASFRIAFLITTVFFVLSCQKDKEASYEEIEQTLSGEWKIISYLMPKYGLGRYYQGNWIYQDTLLQNVGSINIPMFKAEDLDLFKQKMIPLNWTLTTDNEEFAHTIEYLIPRENGVFLALRPNFENIESEAGKFVNSSQIFQKNVEVLFENKNRLIITDANPDDTYKVILVRK